MILFYILIGGLLLFAPLIIAIIALARANRAQDELRQMRTVVVGLQQRGVQPLPEEQRSAPPEAEPAAPAPPPPPSEHASEGWEFESLRARQYLQRVR